MKSPHNQRPDDEAREQTEEFIAAHFGHPATEPKRVETPAASPN
jgi:hypothetical protein